MASNKLNVIALVIECIRYALRQTPAKIGAEFLSKKKPTTGTGFSYARRPMFLGHVRNEDSLLALGLFSNLSVRRGLAQRAPPPPGAQSHRPGPAVERGRSRDHGPPCAGPCGRDAAGGRPQGAGTAGVPARLHPALPPLWGSAAGWGGRRTGQGCSSCNCPGISGDSPT